MKKYRSVMSHDKNDAKVGEKLTLGLFPKMTWGIW